MELRVQVIYKKRDLLVYSSNLPNLFIQTNKHSENEKQNPQIARKILVTKYLYQLLRVHVGDVKPPPVLAWLVQDKDSIG